MIKIFQQIALLVLVMLLPLNSLAIDAQLYQGTVPVASYSSSDFTKSAAAALTQVLVKVSGNLEIANDEMVKKALEKPDQYIQSYNYDAQKIDGQNQLSLKVRFSSRQVDKLLDNINQPKLSGQKTQTLVWLVEKNAQGQLDTVHNASDPIVAAMRVAAQQQAMPLIWPVMDLQDLSAASPEQIWQLDKYMVEQASRRYQAKAILIGRIEQTEDEKWQGNWVWSDGMAEPKVWETDGNDAPAAAVAVLADLIKTASVAMTSTALPTSMDADQVTESQTTLAAQNSGWVNIRISGVYSLDDYADLINYLKRLRTVVDVDASQMQGNTVTLRVKTNQNQQALVRELDASYQLIPDLYGMQDASMPSTLLYNWTAGQPQQSPAILTPEVQSVATTVADPMFQDSHAQDSLGYDQ
jgi:hypothetical protein